MRLPDIQEDRGGRGGHEADRAADPAQSRSTRCPPGRPPYHDLRSMSALYHIVEDERPPLAEGVSPVRGRLFVQR